MNGTAMDSLGIPQQIRKQRLGHSSNGVTEGYTHTFTQDERATPEKLGELFGAGWPEGQMGKLISFPNLLSARALAWEAFTRHCCQSVGIDSRWPDLASTAAADFAPQPVSPG
jgi:hypothetical protein